MAEWLILKPLAKLWIAIEIIIEILDPSPYFVVKVHIIPLE